MATASPRAFGCVVLAGLFLTAGILHFRAADEFVKIVPPFVPAKQAVVLATGAMEIAFAAGLLVPAARRTTGRLLALYLLAVLPANIYQALARVEVAGVVLPDWAAALRVALQFPLIALCLWLTGGRRR